MGKQPEIDFDDTDVRPEQIGKIGGSPEFDPKAGPHIHFLAHASSKIESGKIDDFRDPENLKKFRAAKDYAVSDEKHAAHVQGELDKFMERLKKQEDEKNAYLKSTGSTKESAWLKGFLKAVDEYVDVSSAPELSEEHYWKNGWGNTREEIIKNIGKFYVPINVKGQFRLKHDGPDGETEFLKKEDFLNIFEAHRTILTVESPSGTRNKDISIGQMFTAHNKSRPYYMGLTFNPDPKWNNPNIYNQFQGWPIKPVKGDVQIFLDYAYDVSFNRDDKNTEWGLAWSAQIFLEPHIVMGTAMVHRGEEGIGKSFFAETLAMMMGKYYVKITDFDQVFGQFNAHIEYALLTHFEEAFWAGDRRAEGRFKDHISGTTRIINQKNLPMRQCQIYPRSLLNTNSRWAVPAGPVARRFGIFEVSDAHQREVEYFARLDAWRKNGGVEALLYYFLTDVDITKVDLRNPPRTLALMENQIATLRGVKRFWFDVLRSAKLPYFHKEDDNYHVVRDVMYHYWLAWCRMVNHKNQLSPETFGAQFKELIPALDANGKVQRGRNGAVVSLVLGGRQSTGDREYFHKIPTVELCRQLWEIIYEARYSWEDTKDDKGQDVEGWEKFDVSEWVKRRRNIMDFNSDF
jgi:hypothetical protein